MRLLAYCLMPNRFHLLLWPRADAELSIFMRWLTMTHARRCHAHHRTAGTGHLYQGRYKSFPVQSDGHFARLGLESFRRPRGRPRKQANEGSRPLFPPSRERIVVRFMSECSKSRDGNPGANCGTLYDGREASQIQRDLGEAVDWRHPLLQGFCCSFTSRHLSGTGSG